MPNVKHVVLLKFKADAAADDIDAIFVALSGLPDKIPGLLDYHGGRDSSPEGRAQGYSHGFIMTFEDAASRDAYLPNPDHDMVRQMILPLVEGVLAFDFEI